MNKNGSNVGIIYMLMEHCVGLAKDKHGCRVLQACFIKYADDQSILRSFLDILISDVVNLASHKYGNFVLQCLIRMSIPDGISLVVSHIMDYIVELSMDKHGSHFMETCIKRSTDLDLVRIIFRLMDSDRFLDVLQDAIGNYVAQCAILRARGVKGNAYHDLHDRIMSMYSSLQSHPFGEWVLGSSNS